MNIIKFIIIFFTWFLSSLFINDSSIYQELTLPFFAPSGFIFGIVWPILYFLITLSIVMIIKENKLKDIKAYLLALGINYVLNQLFTIVFFGLNNLFLGFVVCLGVFVSSVCLFNETSKLNMKSARILIPYIIWTLFATILSLSIYIMN